MKEYHSPISSCSSDGCHGKIQTRDSAEDFKILDECY